MTTVREARIDAAKNAILNKQPDWDGYDTTVPEYVAAWLAEAVVDALFTADKLIDNATIAQAWGLTAEDMEKVNG